MAYEMVACAHVISTGVDTFITSIIQTITEQRAGADLVHGDA